MRQAGLALWVIGLAVLGAWTALKVPVSSDLTLFLPEAASPKQQVLLDQLHQGPANRVLLASIAGGSQAERSATSRRLRAKLRDSSHFLRVANGQTLLPDPERRFLMQNRYLLSPRVEPSKFQPPSLRNSLERRLEELRAPTSVLTKELVARDPTGEFLALVRHLETSSGPARRNGVWVGPDGETALMLLYTQAPGTDLDAQGTAQGDLRRTFRQVRTAPDLELELTGPGVFAVQSRAVIREEARTLSVIGSLGVAFLLLAVFRRPKALILSGLPLGSGVLAGILAVWWVFGAVHGITLAFGVTLLGVAIDYPIHFLSHLRGNSATNKQVLARVWPTLRIGVITTVMAYAVLLTTDFQGLKQLGLFAASGLATAALVTRWGLAPLAAGLRGENGPVRRLQRWIRPWWSLRVALLCLAVAATVLLSLRLPGALERDLQALSPVPEASQARFGRLRALFGAPEIRHSLIVTGTNRQQVLARSEKAAAQLRALEQAGTIEHYRAPTLLLPSLSTQKRRQAALPPRNELATDLRQARAGLPFREDLFEPFLTDVATARSQSRLSLQDLEGTFFQFRVASLLSPLEAGQAAVLPLSAADGQDLGEILANRLDGPHYRYLNLKAETEGLVYGFMEAGLSRLALGIGVLALLLGAGLRSVPRLARVTIPVSLALVATLGALVAVGQAITLFHILALMLVFGLGVDYGLFFSRPPASPEDREVTLRALVTCAGSTLLVFGALATSTIPVLHQTGLTVTVGVIFAFLMAAAFATPGQHPFRARHPAFHSPASSGK